MKTGKVLFLGVGDIGDAVMKTAVLKSIRRHRKNASIHILLGSWNYDLLKGSSLVDKIYCYDYPWGNLYCGLNRSRLRQLSFLFFSSLLNTLRQQKFDAAISFSGSKMDYLLMFFLRSKMKIGYKEWEWSKLFLTHPVEAIRGRVFTRIESDLSLLKPLGIDAEYCLPELQLNSEDRSELDTFLKIQKADGLLKIITICPGVGGPLNKQWLPEYFSEVADSLSARKQNLVIISGSLQEAELIRKVKGYSKNNMLINDGRLSLRGFAALIERSDLVISNCSLPMHLAAAFGRPAVVINGGFYDHIDALRWGYKTSNMAILTADVGPRPRGYWHPVCINHVCMREITPGLVLDEADKLLSSSTKQLLTDHVNSRVFPAAHCSIGRV